MANKVERIVVQITARDKQAIAEKAKQLGVSMSELMRRGALAYESSESIAALGALADAARDAADRAGLAIDEALSFIDTSNQRIAAMEIPVSRRQAWQAI